MKNDPANGHTYTTEELAAWIGRTVSIAGLPHRAKVLEIVPVRRGGSLPENERTLFVRFENGAKGAGWLPADFV